ncbi:iron-siderophore ABC transporter substrate-binding protein [Nocardioides insulae]|uniref:ABC transporter substrate-binding protein n=1 Tax=Nocardioides insulae TaxID=394734 RepID=UPI0004213436|nr:iron-siderophore ABC transporter substrate-binding protein [Nocardioides insulae]
MTAPRRAARTALAVLALLIPPALAACGDTSTSVAAGETRTVVDVEGTEMEVPVDPQRVVTLSEPTLDGVLALGVTPVGTVSGRGQSSVPSYLADEAGEIPLLGGVAAPNYEKIANADPDLILVDGTSINNNPEAIGVLRKIAPTFYTGYAGGDWRANFELVAEALNEKEPATAVLAEYDAKVAEAKKDLTSYADDTFSVVRWQGSSAAMILKELPAGMALSDLGLQRPGPQDKRGRGHSEPVSLENIATIDADYMFFGTLGGSSNANPDAGGAADLTGAQQALAQAEEVPGFSTLAAYRTGHIYPVDGSLWTSTGGPILMSRIVDNVTGILA